MERYLLSLEEGLWEEKCGIPVIYVLVWKL